MSKLTRNNYELMRAVGRSLMSTLAVPVRAGSIELSEAGNKDPVCNITLVREQMTIARPSILMKAIMLAMLSCIPEAFAGAPAAVSANAQIVPEIRDHQLGGGWDQDGPTFARRNSPLSTRYRAIFVEPSPQFGRMSDTELAQLRPALHTALDAIVNLTNSSSRSETEWCSKLISAAERYNALTYFTNSAECESFPKYALHSLGLRPSRITISFGQPVKESQKTLYPVWIVVDFPSLKQQGGHFGMCTMADVQISSDGSFHIETLQPPYLLK